MIRCVRMWTGEDGDSIFALGFVLALVILPGRVKPRVPTVRAALARHAIGNCHHFEAADGARQGLTATMGAEGR